MHDRPQTRDVVHGELELAALSCCEIEQRGPSLIEFDPGGRSRDDRVDQLLADVALLSHGVEMLRQSNRFVAVPDEVR